MADGRLAQDLAASGYDPEHYVSRLSEEGEMPLLEMKQKVQILAEKTAQELKKNVYKNYTQFIETAREISILEGEMYQVSHMLTEQKTLMNSMLETSLVSDKVLEGEMYQVSHMLTEQKTLMNSMLETSLVSDKVLEGEMYQVSHMLTEQKTLMNSMLETSLVSDKVLEGEMYQVSHMLTEQKTLMNSMLETSLVSDKVMEGEMYQVSHMLTEQKTLMNSMLETSLVSDKVVVEEPQKETEQENPEEETRRNLAFLLEKVEGCSSVTEVPGRQLIHNGDLAELDLESLAQLHKVHMFLLNDSLMIATWLPNRRGPVRYKFQGLYELDNLASVNIRDAGPVKNAFKILMFPDSKIYQADSAKSKRQWLDVIEETKKSKMARDKQKKETALKLAEQQSSSALKAEEDLNPFEEPVQPLDEKELAQIAMETELLNADWLQELPEDLDMCIAQRDFEGAVDLVEKVNDHLKECQKTPAVKEFRARIDNRIKLLTEGLMSELQVSPERSLRGGPRAARRAVAQLIRLGRSAQACGLFLKNRSAIIKYNIRQLKFEGATTLYIRCLCGVFFSSLSETGREFHRAFPEHYGCFSAFVVWMKEEVESFVKIFKRHVFDSKSNFATIAECVSIATKHCNELSSAGLEVGFCLDSLIAEDLERVIRETKDQLIDGVKYRAAGEVGFCLDSLIAEDLERMVRETRDQLIDGVKYRGADDRWRPMNHLNVTDCNKFVEDMAAVGIDLQSSVYNECFINLTMNTAQFCKSCIVLAQSLILVYSQDRDMLITQTIVQVFKAQISHIETSIKSGKWADEIQFLMKNAQFILEVLMAKIEQMYKSRSISFPHQLIAVNGEYRRLKAVVASLSKK